MASKRLVRGLELSAETAAMVEDAFRLDVCDIEATVMLVSFSDQSRFMVFRPD